MKEMLKLTIKSMKINIKNNLLILISIMLSSMLLFSIALAFSTYRVNKVANTIDYYGDQYAIYTNVYLKQKKVLDENKNIDKYFFISKVSDFIDMSENDYVNNEYILYNISSDFDLDLEIAGRLPNDENELLIDTTMNNKYKLNNTYEINGKTYTIVGLYSNSDKLKQARIYNGFQIPIFTKTEQTNETGIFWVYLNNLDDVYNNLRSIGFNLNTIENTKNYSDVGVIMNEEYLGLLTTANGQKAYAQAIMQLALMLVMTVLSFITLFVIYNSFAISVNERKKKYAMYKSIGATPKQIMFSVIFEAFILTLIALPLGYLLSVGLTKVMLYIINNLLIDVVKNKYIFAIYPRYIAFAIFYILASVFIASFSPAKRASEASVIDVIRQNTEINKKGGLFKKRKLIKKIFGIEGIISAKNTTRNYRKYNVTAFSIAIGCVLYLTFSIFMNTYFYVYNSDNIMINEPVKIYLNNDYNIDKDIINDLINLKQVKKYVYSSSKPFYFDYNKEDITYMLNNKNIGFITYFDENSYNEIKKEFNIENDNPLILGKNKSIIYEEFTYKQKITTIPFFNKDRLNIDVYMANKEDINKKGDLIKKFTNLNVINDYGNYLNNIENQYNQISIPGIILPYEENLLFGEDDGNVIINLEIKSDNYYKLDKEIKGVIEKYSDYHIEYTNYFMDNYESYQMTKVIGIIIYLVIFILFGITIISIFGTINTNLNLRRREFAVLRSMGLNKKGFNKMILYESLMLSLKGLIFGILLALAIIALFIKIFTISEDSLAIIFFLIPPYVYLTPFLICSLTVFIVTYLSFYIATNKFKKDNIADILKENSF